MYFSLWVVVNLEGICQKRGREGAQTLLPRRTSLLSRRVSALGAQLIIGALEPSVGLCWGEKGTGLVSFIRRPGSNHTLLSVFWTWLSEWSRLAKLPLLCCSVHRSLSSPPAHIHSCGAIKGQGSRVKWEKAFKEFSSVQPRDPQKPEGLLLI